MEEEIDFEEQLEQEKLEKLRKENIDLGTYTDKDGTVFEWDKDKKAWFPKIDEDFIAKYQMNYGATEGSEEGNSESADKDQTSQNSDEYSKDYWNYYYQYYQNYYQTEGQKENSGDQSQTKSESKETSDSAEKNESNDGEKEVDINSEEYYKQYYDYYNYYYGNYAEYNSEGYSQGQDEGEQGEGQEKEDGDQGDGKRKGKKKGQKRKFMPKPPEDPKWFEMDESKNTNIYVSGMPTDITEEEFKELMQKFGLVMFDPLTKKPKLKLYTDEHGQPKGDGRCCYIKLESVELALKLLDGYVLRDHKIQVEKAKFTMKGNFDPTKKKKKLTNKEKRKMKEKQEKLFDWRPERQVGTRLKCEKVVVLKHMFQPSEFEEDPMLINELRDDVRDESAKFGEVKNVKIFDNHPEGVMTVSFKTAEDADACIEALNGRWFAKKRISAESWDGRTKYEIQESEAERDERLKKWETFLEDDASKEKKEKEDNKSQKGNTSTEVSADTDGHGAAGSAQSKDNSQVSTAPAIMDSESVSDVASGAESVTDS